MPEAEQDAFLSNTSVERLNTLTRIANDSGRPWADIYSSELAAIDTKEGWQERY
jgi:hypothetical protein